MGINSVFFIVTNLAKSAKFHEKFMELNFVEGVDEMLTVHATNQTINEWGHFAKDVLIRNAAQPSPTSLK